MNDRLVWIDCEMTGLDLAADALIEVAVLVTDYELNVLGDGIDLVIAPPPAALEQMGDFVRDMHTASGLLAELDARDPARRRRAAGARVHLRVREGAAQGRPGRATRSAPTGPSWSATCRGSRRTCTTATSTSARSRNSSAAGTRGSTTRPRPRPATTAPWPTSPRASPSSATTARPSSSPSPAPTPTPPEPPPPWSAPRTPRTNGAWRRPDFWSSAFVAMIAQPSQSGRQWWV